MTRTVAAVGRLEAGDLLLAPDTRALESDCTVVISASSVPGFAGGEEWIVFFRLSGAGSPRDGFWTLSEPDGWGAWHLLSPAACDP